MNEQLILGLSFAVLSATAVLMRTARGMLVTGVSGLHSNLFLFFGVGLTLYTRAFGLITERVSYDVVLKSISLACWPMLVGYAIVLVFEYRAYRSFARARRLERAKQPERFVRSGRFHSVRMSTRMAILIIGGALVGYIGSQFEIATSGVGTLLPVLKVLVYPALVVIVARSNFRRPSHLFLTTAFVAATAYLAARSVWRSELVMFTAAVALGVVIRRPRWLIPTAVAGSGIFLLMLPFLQLKKIDYESVAADPVGAFSRTLDAPFAERLESLIGFWSERMNYARETGYVVAAIEGNQIRVRHGRTYVEAIYQLIPRVLWPSKPSYNQLTNYWLARDIGLLGWADLGTSWSVNIFAEAVWNFGPKCLLLFVGIVFVAAEQLDRIVRRVIKHSGVRWVVHSALFFELLSMVGLVFQVTYLLWLLLIGMALDSYMRAVESHGLRSRVIVGEAR